MAFDPRNIPPEDFDRRLAELGVEKEAALAELARIDAEMEWWEHGRKLFGRRNGSAPDPAQKPTLREAVRRVMREGGATQWRVGDLAGALSQRGWLPTGKNAEQRVGDIVLDMTKKRQLVRVARGLYSLPDMMPAGSQLIPDEPGAA